MGEKKFIHKKAERTEKDEDDDTNTNKREKQRKQRKQRERMLNDAVIPAPKRLTAAFFGILLLVLAAFADGDDGNCSRTCVAENCHFLAIRYGKYCGKGYGGCPGEKPCDDVDACCMIHDECVTLKGMGYVKCHKQLKRCLKRAQKSGKVGFSQECPYKTVIPTMNRGMDLGIFLLEKVCGVLSEVCNVTIPLI